MYELAYPWAIALLALPLLMRLPSLNGWVHPWSSKSPGGT